MPASVDRCVSIAIGATPVLERALLSKAVG